MRIAAIVPARLESKRIPQKNFKLFNGKPMVQHVLETLEESHVFDSIFLSTDAPLEKLTGLSPIVNILSRPEALAGDFATITQVVKHVIEQVEATGEAFDAYCLVYATSVLLTADIYREAAAKFDLSVMDYLLSVTDYGHPVDRGFYLDEKFHLDVGIFDKAQRTQDFKPFYHDAGCFCFGAKEVWLGEQNIFGPKTEAMILPRSSAVDIDFPEDWQIAEALFQLQQKVRD